MAVSKSKFINIIARELKKSGYIKIADSVTGANGLFIKTINSKYYLSVGLITSSIYKSRFTASFYLSKCTRWASVWGDIPKESYERVGRFLKEDERKLYLDLEHSETKVIDSWWHRNNVDEIQKFVKVVEISEQRFLNQKDLFLKIENSSEIKEFVNSFKGVLTLLGTPDNYFEYKFTPRDCIDKIPLEIFKAAERTILERGTILNINTVKSLAADTWRQLQANGDLLNIYNHIKEKYSSTY